MQGAVSSCRMCGTGVRSVHVVFPVTPAQPATSLLLQAHRFFFAAAAIQESAAIKSRRRSWIMKSNRFISLVAAACILTGFALAQDKVFRLPLDQVMTKQDQEQTGISKLSPKEREAFEAWLTQFALRAVQASNSAPATKPRAAGAYAGAASGHWIKRIVERGKIVELEDGSLWELSSFSRVDAILWLPVEKIVVTGGDMPGYPYKLVNPDSKSAADAKLLSK